MRASLRVPQRPDLRWLPVILGVCVCFLIAPESQAQERRADIGFGGQIGDPTGLTLRLYDRSPFIYDFLAAWDFDDDFILLNAHGLWERRLRNSPLNFFYGPGVLLGLQERRGDNELLVGLSFNVGINYFVERFEVFIQVTPRPQSNTAYRRRHWRRDRAAVLFLGCFLSQDSSPGLKIRNHNPFHLLSSLG